MLKNISDTSSSTSITNTSDSTNSNSNTNDQFSSSSSSSTTETETETSSNMKSYTNSSSSTSFTTDESNDNESDSSSSGYDMGMGMDGKKERKRKRKYIVNCMVICFFCVIILVNVMIIIIMMMVEKKKKKINEEMEMEMEMEMEKKYMMVYNVYEKEGEEESFEEMFLRKEKARRFHFNDEFGSGYVYPMNYNDGSDKEYEIQGTCSCCVECFEDNDCGDDGNSICMDGICLQCENDDQCKHNLICNRGMCIEGVCHNDNDCDNGKLCSVEGECIKGCKNDDECTRSNEICHYDGKCIEGCRSDTECNSNKGELCLDNQCYSEGCRDNFDCNSYEHACINNDCVSTENSEKCNNDNECESGNYCDLEYMICVKLRKDTLNERREDEAIPVVCALYGVVSLFILVSSYSIATNIAKSKLVDQCYEKCSENYFFMSKSDSKVEGVDITETKKDIKREETFKCSGACRISYDFEKGFIWDGYISPGYEFFDSMCRKITFEDIIAAEDNIKAKTLFDASYDYKCKQFQDDISHPCVINRDTSICESVDIDDL